MEVHPRVVMVSHNQTDMDNLVDMVSSHHKAMVSHQEVAMELLLMVSHMATVPPPNSLVTVVLLQALIPMSISGF